VIATRFGLAGASVAVNHRHTPDRAAAVLAELHALDIAAIAVDADVSVRAELDAAVDQVVTGFGHWDVLVSNAAIATTKPLVEFDEATIDAMFAVNVKAVIWGMQIAAAKMADGGRIINLGSSTTGLMLAGYAVYDASKAGVEQLTRIGSHELGHRGITVNVLAPGATATPTYAAGRGEELVSRFSAMSAFGRLGTPDEIADVATFLASDQAGWITSQVIRVNGGTA
jgi:3-oxoacyl-[acyl-carrier protein] reductase